MQHTMSTTEAIICIVTSMVRSRPPPVAAVRPCSTPSGLNDDR